MAQEGDQNSAIWKSDQIVEQWTTQVDESRRSPQWQLMAELLPFEANQEFVFADLGAGTGAAARAILDLYPRATAVLTDFSPQMMAEARKAMASYGDRYSFVEFDMASEAWPEEIEEPLDAVVSSQCVHHLADDRKESLFREVFKHLAKGGWYLNFDPVNAPSPVVEAAWNRANERRNPNAAEQAKHRTPEQQARYENHIRYIAQLAPQVDLLERAGFEAVDVYWKQLDYAIFGGRKPA